LKTIKYYLYYFKNILKFGTIDIFFNRIRFKKFSTLVNNFSSGSDLEECAGYLQKIDIENIINTKEEIIIENWIWKQGNMTLFELYCLLLIAKNFNPKTVFEIGTFDGRTTLHIALNTNAATEIHTLDIPYEELKDASLSVDSGDEQLINKKNFQIGECFLKRKEFKNIQQHLSDSAKFNYLPYNKRVDLFFVDGAHSYEYVRSDTENALNCLSEKGVILWHDYGNVIDVTNYLNKLSSKMAIYRINNTTLAIHSKSLSIN
jgi:Methyltransferase domain